jgi:hypothetical protein
LHPFAAKIDDIARRDKASAALRQNQYGEMSRKDAHAQRAFAQICG